MKKCTKLAAFASALFFSGMAMTANAAVTLAPMPTDGTTFDVGLISGSGTLYYFEAKSDGVLTINCTQGGNPAFLYPGWNSSAEEPTGSPLDPATSSDAGWTFNVEEGDTYYAYDYAFNEFAVRTMSASFEATGGGTVTPPVTEFPLTVADFEVGKTYDGFTWETFGDISGPNTCLVYTPETDGILTVIQTGSDANNTHFYSKEWNQKSTFSTYNNMVMTDDGYYKSLGGSQYELTYKVVGGATYYYYAKSESADLISSMTATFESTGASTENIAELNVPFNCNGTVYQFTPTVSGIMTIVLDRYAYDLCGMGSHLVYTDKSHLNRLENLAGEEYEDGKYEMTYYVNADQTYYFWYETIDLDGNGTNMVTITSVVEKGKSVVLKVTDLLPQPGDASWNENIYNYASGFMYTFSPSNVVVGSATVTYETNEGTKTVNPTVEDTGAGWIVRLYDALVDIKANGKSNTYFTVTLNDVTYEGEKIQVDVDEPNAYVTPGMGTISIDYMKAAQEMALVSKESVWPEKIYETWTEGDVNGKATLVFTNPIKSVGAATVTLGNQNWGSVSGGDDPDPSADIPYTIDGNVLTLDFTKLTLSPGTKSYTTCTVFVTGIEDIYGQGMGLPSIDEKLPYEATEAENPVIGMEEGTVLQPEGNRYQLSLDAFVLQWAGEALTAVEGATLEATLSIDGNEVGKVPVTITEGEYTEENDCLSIDLTEYEGQYGLYSVVIPQGIVENAEGHINPYQVVTAYILEANDDYVITPEPGEYENGEFNEIKVTYENCTIAVNQDAGAAKWANNSIPASTLYDSLVISIAELPEGEFSLVIPATYLIINGNQLNKEIVATYTIVEEKGDTDGIAGINADANGVYNVYNMNGVRILSTSNAQDVRNLAKGLYIINGKKVIRK